MYYLLGMLCHNWHISSHLACKSLSVVRAEGPAFLQSDYLVCTLRDGTAV